MLNWALGVFAVLLALLVVRTAVRTVTVYEYERGLRYARGRYRGILDPGLYWHVSGLSIVRKVDLRPSFISVPGQEVLSADGVAVKVSLAAQYRVVDPNTAINKLENYLGALYLELQLAARQIISSTPVEQLLEGRAELGRQLREIATPKVAAMGLELIDADLKDLTLPGELKKLFTQVVKARQEGLASLEKARGETAALRNLANAAQMIERNPQLLQLRLLQTMGQTPGNTLVLGVQQPGGPIPLRAKESSQLEASGEGGTEHE